MEIRDSLEYAESIINAMRDPLIVLDQDLKVISASRSFYDVFKIKPEEAVGQFIYDLGDHQWDIPKLRELLQEILPKSTSFNNFEVEYDFPSIGKRTMLLDARQISRLLGKPRIILLVIEDITESKKILDELNDRIRDLERIRGEAVSSEHKVREMKRMIAELQNRILRRQR